METGHPMGQLEFGKRDAGALELGKRNKSRLPSNNGSPDYRLIEPLTDRELSFLDCLANGISNKEIARSLCVSENTVKFHLKNVYSKFSVRTRMQAINAAYELGVLPVPGRQQLNNAARAS